MRGGGAAPGALAALVLAGATCTPQQRPWFVPVGGQPGPYVAPADKGLRVIVEGSFPRGSLWAFGEDGSGDRHALPVVARGGQWEIGVPPGLRVPHLGLSGSCSGCLARCPTPDGVSARVVAVEVAPFWTRAATTPPQRTTLLRPGGHARFVVSIASTQLPAVELSVDSPRWLAGAVNFGMDREHLVGRVQTVWRDGAGHKALVVFRNGTSGVRVPPVTFGWTATARLSGPCPPGVAGCDGGAEAALAIESVTEECCRDGRESAGAEEIVCKSAKGVVKRVGPRGAAYCDRPLSTAGQPCTSSVQCEGWCMATTRGGLCSATQLREGCFEAWDGAAAFSSCE